MYKVFINEKVIFFTNDDVVIKNSKNALYVHFFNNKIIEIMCDFLLKESEYNCVIVKVVDVEKAFNSFIASFKHIKAAGGKVVNTKGKILFIFRLGKWDLPKGKIEKNESEEQAAIREVEEETGVSGLIIKKRLLDTYHIYSLKGELVLKQSTWFEMYTDDKSQLTPQREENISDAQWINSDAIENIVLANTYASIKEVLIETNSIPNSTPKNFPN